MKKILFPLLTIFFPVLSAFAQSNEAVKNVGPHSPLFTFEKNENPQNIMIVYTKLNDDCSIQIDPANQASPVVDFYWLMDGKSFKPVHNLIKSGVRDRLEVQPGKNSTTFQIQINDLKELKTDVSDMKLSVNSLKKSDGKCEVKSLFTLGESDGNAVMQVKTIYSEASKTLAPPFRKLKSVTLKGLNLKSGQPITKTYSAK